MPYQQFPRLQGVEHGAHPPAGDAELLRKFALGRQLSSAHALHEALDAIRIDLLRTTILELVELVLEWYGSRVSFELKF